MKKRGQSSRSCRKALRIFCVGTSWRKPNPSWFRFWRTIGLSTVLAVSLEETSLANTQGELSGMKRRPQGILTGMPFMTHVSSRSFVDDAGRKFHLASSPRRIVSLAPSITEMLFAIGAGDLVVGVTPFCDFPPEAARKPKVGYGSPNVESLVALQPDLVLAPQEFVKPDLVATLDHLRIPVFFLASRTVDGVLTQIQTLGRMVNREAEAAALVMELRQRITAVKQRVQGQPPVRVFYVLNSEPLITVGPGSFIDQLIGLAGGLNVAAKSTMPYPRLNIETVLLEDPEVLLFPVGSHADIPDDQRRAWQRWTGLSAIKQQRLHPISGDLLNRPGPRIVEGLERLAEILHPPTSAPSEPRSSGGS